MAENIDVATAQAAANSGVTAEVIKRKLEQTLGATYVEIEDMSGMYYFWLISLVSTYQWLSCTCCILKESYVVF